MLSSNRFGDAMDSIKRLEQQVKNTEIGSVLPTLLYGEAAAQGQLSTLAITRLSKDPDSLIKYWSDDGRYRIETPFRIRDIQQNDKTYDVLSNALPISNVNPNIDQDINEAFFDVAKK